MSEVGDLVEALPELVASLTLICPFQAIAASRLRPLGSRLLVIHGDVGPQGEIASGILRDLPAAVNVVLHDYFDIAWGDPAADRGDQVASAMLPFLSGASQAEMGPLDLDNTEGEVAGVTYSVHGSGEPLVLFPITLSPSQWDPLLPLLSKHFCVITVGGVHIGSVAVLAQRALAGYGAAVRAFIVDVAPKADERVLEIGCGSGEVTRLLARVTGGEHPIVGVDLNRYLLREAAQLAHANGVADRITFREGNAESLPFPPDSFDVTVACTVMEEVNADRMLAEMVRVTRPGGRIGAMVRATDMPTWIGLPLESEMKAKAERKQSVGAAEAGCADASLYRRFVAAGLAHLTMGPKLGTNRDGPGFAFMRSGFEASQRAGLSPDELHAWDTAVAQADAEGTFMYAPAYHCAVGIRTS